MDKVFMHQVGRNIMWMIYIIIKSVKSESLIADIEETFATLQQYELKLHPTKCIFRVTSGKFLGYLVIKRGIESNPDKVQSL